VFDLAPGRTTQRGCTLAGVSLLLLAGAAGLLAPAALLASCLRLRSFAAFVLAAYLLGSAEVIAIVLLLSTAGWVTRGGLLAAIAVTLVAAGYTWHACGRPRPPSLRICLADLRPAFRDPVLAILIPSVVVCLAYLAVVAISSPQADMDALLYHLPRAALWAQEQSVSYIPHAPDERVNAMPPNAEIGTLATMLLAGGDRFVGVVQLVSLAALCIAIGAIGRRLGLERREAIFGAVLFATLPVVTLQAPTALTDLAVAAPLACAAYFAIGATRGELTLAALGLALALGTKLTTVLALPVLVAFVVTAQPTRRWAALGIAGLGGLTFGSYWYVINLVETGSADGGLAEAFDQSPPHDIASTLDRAWALLVDLLDLPGVTLRHAPLLDVVLSPLLFLVLLIGAGVVALRGRRLEALAVALAAVPVAFAGPLLERWDRVPRWTWSRVFSPAETGPFDMLEGFDTMSSWYGPVLLAVVVGAAPLAVVGVRRHKLRTATLVALASPVLFVPVVASALVYDELRGRFFAFPVALAMAAGGLVLRARPLAWTVGALAVVAMSVSLLAHNGTWHAERWQAYATKRRSDADDVAVFRFLATELPSNATFAVAARRDTYLYPLWDAALRRKIRFLAPDGVVPADAEFVIVGPNAGVPDCATGWRKRLASQSGWVALERGASGACAA
jgi:hypothetical protein